MSSTTADVAAAVDVLRSWSREEGERPIAGRTRREAIGAARAAALLTCRRTTARSPA